MNRIPSHIWRFCTKEFELYPLSKAELEDAKKKIQAIYEEGGNRSWKQTKTQTGYTTSPVAVKLEKIEELENSPDVLLNMKRCRCVEDVFTLLSDEEKEVVEAIFWKKKHPYAIARELSLSVRKIFYIKRKAVEKLAVRWGLLA